MLRLIDMILSAIGVLGSLAAIIAYVRLPERAPMITWLDGIPSRETVTKHLYLIAPLVTGSLALFCFLAAYNITQQLTSLQLRAQSIGDLAIALFCVWIAAVFFAVGSALQRNARRIPWLIMPGGVIMIGAVVVAGMACVFVAR
jgi:hypothetical protein